MNLGRLNRVRRTIDLGNYIEFDLMNRDVYENYLDDVIYRMGLENTSRSFKTWKLEDKYFIMNTEINPIFNQNHLVESCRKGQKIYALFVDGNLIGMEKLDTKNRYKEIYNIPVYLSQEVSNRISLHFDVRGLSREAIGRILPNGDLKVPALIPLNVIGRSLFNGIMSYVSPGMYPTLSLPGQETVSVRII